MILKTLSIAIFMLASIQFFKTDIILLLDDPSYDAKRIHPIELTSLVDVSTLKTLDECANAHSQFLKGKISQDSITKFKIFYYGHFYKKNKFPVYQYSFKKPKFINHSGKWSCKELGDNPGNTLALISDAKNLLRWLEKNYVPNSDFEFFYLVQEPYIVTWNLKPKILNKLNELLAECPLLIGCNHPDLSWTKNAVLIPDGWIRHYDFSAKMQDLFDSKKIKPFHQRQPKVYFRAGLTGPKLPYTMKNMAANARQNLLQMLGTFPYLDYKVTNISTFTDEKKADGEYKKYILENFSYLKCDLVDFVEHAKNKYLLSCDGIGAAWSRVPYIMATGSVLFLNAQCEQYFYRLMKNQETHVAINQDFSNLDTEFHKLENNPEMAEKIGSQGKEFAKRFLTKAPIDTYMLLVLKKLESYYPKTH
jgi:hypothetical protein